MRSRLQYIRCRRWCRLPWLLVWIAVLNFSILIYFVMMQKRLPSAKQHTPLQSHANPDDYWLDQITFVFREFEEFENNIVESIKSLHEKAKTAKIIVVSDNIPYPPIEIPEYAKLVTLNLLPNQKSLHSHLDNFITTKYTIILPDSVHLVKGEGITLILRHLESQPPNVKAAVWSLDPAAHLHCTGLDVDLKQWTAKYFPSQSTYCDTVLGTEFIIAIRSADLFELSHPLQRPIPQMFFLQTAVRRWKIAIGNTTVFQQDNDRALFQDAHSSWKHRTKQFAYQKHAYNVFGIKRVLKDDGQEEWYGCTKDSNRCFGTVLNSMPEYLYKGRWTPPCCLKALRTTARHVFRVLENHGVRYWLEGGSLLGAVRSGDVIPWDYDVDIGIYMSDVSKSFYLTSAQTGSYEDEEGFIWEKAPEGEFYRVQYSQTNRLHVDIYPFFPKDGNMTKNTWMKDHRQDMPFPEKYLNPTEKLSFVGSEVHVPNHYKEFLELKFGKGVLEKPKYPNNKAAITEE